MKKSNTAVKCLLLALSVLTAAQVLTGCAPKTTAQSQSGSSSQQADTVQITDDVGRKVTIPAPSKLKKVYYTSPLGMLFVYSLDPSKMAGTAMKFSDAQLKYLPDATKSLPYMGAMDGGGKLNLEALVSSGTQLIISANENITNTTASDADTLQQQLNIPVLVLNSDMTKIANSYTLLGKIFGEQQKAKELSDYCKSVFTNVVDKVNKIPDSKRVKVYYAEQANGLSTEPTSSSHAAALKYAGALNVAAVDAKAGSGFSPVSLEQVISWDPQVIISWSDSSGGAFSSIRQNKDWAGISAVKNSKVYTMPNTPFSWLDRPPSINRFLGIQWVANLLYPDVYKVDIVQVTQKFYHLFYHVDLSTADVKALLKDSVPQ